MKSRDFLRKNEDRTSIIRQEALNYVDEFEKSRDARFRDSRMQIKKLRVTDDEGKSYLPQSSAILRQRVGCSS